MRIDSVKDAEFVVELLRYGLLPIFNENNEIVFWDDYFTYIIPVTEDNTWYGECEKQRVTITYNWAFDFFDVFEECTDKEKEFVATNWGPRYIAEFLYEDRDYINPVIEKWDRQYLKNKLKVIKRMRRTYERKWTAEKIKKKEKERKKRTSTAG